MHACTSCAYASMCVCACMVHDVGVSASVCVYIYANVLQHSVL